MFSLALDRIYAMLTFIGILKIKIVKFTINKIQLK